MSLLRWLPPLLAVLALGFAAPRPPTPTPPRRMSKLSAPLSCRPTGRACWSSSVSGRCPTPTTSAPWR